jgi:hypothetical protein
MAATNYTWATAAKICGIADGFNLTTNMQLTNINQVRPVTSAFQQTQSLRSAEGHGRWHWGARTHCNLLGRLYAVSGVDKHSNQHT